MLKFKNNKELQTLTITYGDFSVNYKYDDGLTASEIITKGIYEFGIQACDKKFLFNIDGMFIYVYNTLTGKVKKFDRCVEIKWFEDGDDVSNYDVIWHKSRHCAQMEHHNRCQFEKMRKEITLKNFLDSEEEFEYNPESNN